MADDLRQYVLRFDIVGPVCFVLDFDPTGREKERILRQHGYTVDRAKVIMIDPGHHPGACRFAGKGDDPIVVEDLLSLRIQRRFFEADQSSCEVVYEDGEITRIGWRKESKDGLCAFVCEKASWEDVIELARVLVRVRELWRLDVPRPVVELLSASSAA